MMDNTLEWQGSSEAETLKCKRVVLRNTGLEAVAVVQVVVLGHALERGVV
jgi:hypothetical protein